MELNACAFPAYVSLMLAFEAHQEAKWQKQNGFGNNYVGKSRSLIRS
jgi:hypothetical protein